MYVFVHICRCYKVINVRCNYYLWYYTISLLFHGNLSKIPPSNSEVENLTRLKCAVKWESLKVGKLAVRRFAAQNTLIPTFRTFHQQGMLV